MPLLLRGGVTQKSEITMQNLKIFKKTLKVNGRPTDMIPISVDRKKMASD